MVPTTPHPLPSSSGWPFSLLSYPPYSATRAAEEQEVELKSGDEREREKKPTTAGTTGVGRQLAVQKRRDSPCGAERGAS